MHFVSVIVPSIPTGPSSVPNERSWWNIMALLFEHLAEVYEVFAVTPLLQHQLETFANEAVLDGRLHRCQGD
jgi:hypothetical protein